MRVPYVTFSDIQIISPVATLPGRLVGDSVAGGVGFVSALGGARSRRGGLGVGKVFAVDAVEGELVRCAARRRVSRLDCCPISLAQRAPLGASNGFGASGMVPHVAWPVQAAAV